jgi:predicted N-acetyltransferase YhbS
MRRVLRPSPAELDRVFLLGFHAWGEGKTREEFLDECRASSKYAKGQWFVLADADGTFLSKLIVYPLEKTGVPRSLGLASIATPPEFQNCGYASELISEVLRSLSAEGTEHFLLFSDIAPAYYERFGFQVLTARFQTRAESVCMVRTPAFPRWSEDDAVVPPSYF